MTGRELILLPYLSNRYQRRRLSTLSEQINIPESEIRVIMRLNPHIWHEVDGCKGKMFEMDNELFRILVELK